MFVSYLDLLDAQHQLFNAELSLSEAKRDRLVALVQIYKALGGGWERKNTVDWIEPRSLLGFTFVQPNLRC